MFADEMVVLCNVSGVEVGDAQIKQYVEYESKIEYGVVKAKLFGANSILHVDVDAQNPKRFDKDIEQQKQ